MPSASIHREEIVIEDSSDDEFESSNSDCEVMGTDPASKSVQSEDVAQSASVDLSPGFRTAAAKAGWDDEALLMAALDGECSDAAHATPDKLRNSGGDACRERKREVRTPGQAITPASANRVHRKPRRPTSIDCGSDASLARLTLDEGSTGSTDHESRRESVVATDELRNESALLRESAGSRRSSPQPNKLQKEIEEAGVCTKDEESDDPCKEIMKPPCLEQLRDELSCAVCLEICLEPSTTSCGHSFCRSCLQSVVRKCGLRCPKCRQALKGEGAINVVLWNTIQILFPDEIAKRIKNKKDDSNAVVTTDSSDQQPTSFVNASAMTSDSSNIWRGRPAVIDRHRPIGNFRRFTPPFRSSRRQVTDLDDEETAEQNNTNARSLSRSLSTRQQEEIDAVLAARLQESELMQASSHGIETFHRRLRESQRQSTDNVMAAVANLRSLASRTARYRTRSQF